MKTLMVAVDESEGSRNVIREAVTLAQTIGAKIVLFHAVGLPPTMPPELLAVSQDEIPALLERQAQAALAELATEVPASLLAGMKVHIGTPWDAICNAAKTENVDLIIVGAHSHRTFDGLLGTTTTRVVDHADRSVLVVRPRPKVG